MTNQGVVLSCKLKMMKYYHSHSCALTIFSTSVTKLQPDYHLTGPCCFLKLLVWPQILLPNETSLRSGPYKTDCMYLKIYVQTSEMSAISIINETTLDIPLKLKRILNQ